MPQKFIMDYLYLTSIVTFDNNACHLEELDKTYALFDGCRRFYWLSFNILKAVSQFKTKI